MKWLSPYRYAYEALIRNEYDDLYEMDYSRREDAVDMLNLQNEYWKDIWILAIIFIGSRVIGYLACLFMNRKA
jgi:hypothetical protein